jgi:hypothetical protein
MIRTRGRPLYETRPAALNSPPASCSLPAMPSHPHRSRRIAAVLSAAIIGSLAGTAAADPYQVEVLVFARPTDPVEPAEPNDHWPSCLARAQVPSGAPGTPDAPTAVGPNRFRLATEAKALQRSGAGLQVLAHLAWQQELSGSAYGPWVRIGDRTEDGLTGCLRAKLAPVPQIEIDLVHEAATGERHSLFGTARIRPGDVHYFDHPALGTLVRLDATTPTTAGVMGGDTAPPTAPSAAPPPPTGAEASRGPLEPPPPPPKKPFRW